MNPLTWYTPAEIWHPWTELLSAVSGDDTGLKQLIADACGKSNVLLASDARSLMFELLVQLRQQDSAARDVVVMPGYTCYTVAAAVIKAGLRIRLYDLHPADLSADTASLQAAVRDDTLAIVSQHLFGIPANTATIQQIAQQANCWHIEDAAQAFGSFSADVMAGTSGDFGLFSMGRGKALAVGGGGALVSDHELKQPVQPSRASSVKDFIKSLATAIATQPLCYGIVERLPLGLGETRFDTTFQPAGLSAYFSRLARSALHRLDAQRAHRAAVAAVYQQQITASTIQPAVDCRPNFTRFPLLASDSAIPAQLYQAGVRRMYPQSIIDVDAIKPYIMADQQALIGSRKIARELVTLPTHRRITQHSASLIAEDLNRWLD